MTPITIMNVRTVVKVQRGRGRGRGRGGGTKRRCGCDEVHRGSYYFLSLSMTMTMMMIIIIIIIMSYFVTTTSSSSIDGRHSFSLTTFDPNGKLGQVERAIIASSLGTPIIAVILSLPTTTENIIAFVSPQILPSPFMIDDGTSRFIQISPQIVIAHSGISSDGRLLANSAQRLVIEHSYTYDEPIPIDIFLEEMSLLYQQYTMKPGSRPFGSTLLVAYMPTHSTTTNNEQKPQLFRIDPSGSVIVYEDNYAIINGKSLNNNQGYNNIESKIKQLILSSSKQKKENDDDNNNDNDNDDHNTTNKKYIKELSQILQEAIKSNNSNNNNKLSSSLPSSSNNNNSKQQQQQQQQQSSSTKTTDDSNGATYDTNTRMKIPLKTRIISATLSKTSGFVVERNEIRNEIN